METIELNYYFFNLLVFYVEDKFIFVVRRAAGHKAGADLHMTGIPVHTPTNWGSRRADDRCLLWPIV